MNVITKADITIKDGNANTAVIPKGTKGFILGVKWGDTDEFVVDFNTHSRILVARQDVVMEDFSVAQPKEKRKTGKQEREDLGLFE